MTKSFHSLKIDWQMPDPPVRPRKWTKVEPGIRSTGSEILGKRLGIGPAGLDCIDAAFKAGLNRFTGWEVEDPEYSKAARIFKRGVHWRSEGGPCRVNQLSGSYDITIVQDKTDVLEQLDHYRGWAVVMDQNVADAWTDIDEALNGLHITTNEIGKNLMTVAQILEDIEGSPGVIIVGGGILGDMTGFAAALAGIPMVFVPTTLLAMADACVGGKTGVNYPPYGKNQIGAFYFPKQVIVWDGWLQTLKQRDLKAGVAECIKHMFLSGDMATAESIAQGNIKTHLADIIKVKADVVAKDPAEEGLRATLNFGHTLGHALEAYSHRNTPDDKTILHGEAVAVGMAFAVLLSFDQGYMSREDMRRMGQIILDARILPNQEELSMALGAKLEPPEVWQSITDMIALDKKSTGNITTSNWILLERPGVPIKGPENNYLVPVSTSELEKTWQSLIASL